MLKIKCFKQSNDSLCGPAVIRSVLHYYGIEASERTIAKKAGHSYKQGCTNKAILKVLKSYGLQAELHSNCTIDDLKYWLGKKIPPIVDWFTGGVGVQHEGSTPNGHASIIVKVTTNLVWLADPENAKIRRITHEDFLRVWFDWTGSASTTIDKGKFDLRTLIVAYRKGQEI